MDGFKNTTKTKYMTEGGTFNERGRRATMGEIAAEDRRMAGRPSEGVSSRPTDSSGRRASDAELGMTSSAKKSVGPSSVAVSKVLAGMTKPMKKALGGGVNSKLITKTIDAKAAGPRAKSTFVDTMPKAGPQPAPPVGLGALKGIDASKLPPKTAKTSAPQFPQFEGAKFTDGPPGSSGGLTREYVDYMQKREDAAYRARLLATQKSKKATGVKTSSGNPLMGGMNRDDIVASKPGSPTMIKKPKPEMIKKPKPELPTQGKPTYRDHPPMPPMPTRGPSMSPAHSDRPMIGRKASGLSVMPKGKR